MHLISCALNHAPWFMRLKPYALIHAPWFMRTSMDFSFGSQLTYIGLARTTYVQRTYGIFGLKITKYTVYIYVYIRFWPPLHIHITQHVHTRNTLRWMCTLVACLDAGMFHADFWDVQYGKIRDDCTTAYYMDTQHAPVNQGCFVHKFETSNRVKYTLLRYSV